MVGMSRLITRHTPTGRVRPNARACYYARYFTHLPGLPMCSIFGIFGLQAADDLSSLRAQALERSQSQRHRGPDWSGVHVDAMITAFETLLVIGCNRETSAK